jgi:hypothetical protein
LNLINLERYPRALTAFDFTWMNINKKIKLAPLVIEIYRQLHFLSNLPLNNLSHIYCP